ncbi:MAG TPA: hypothetical protein VM756_13560, partial [Burkholderiales bacterium]|nr:hypothetical protein [Burkholderiales bacterium]
MRILEGRFGRLVLSDLAAGATCAAQGDPAILMQATGDDLLFLNPGEVHTVAAPVRILVLHAASDWLRASFPAVFGAADAEPFVQSREEITPRIRRLADTLAVEVLNDRFVSAERLDFMLQELLLSIVET